MHRWRDAKRKMAMKYILGVTAFALALSLNTLSADAKGCIKGAAVGGVAGHLAGHHGLAGAAVGCAIGHHEANKDEKANQNPAPDHSQ
jgi:hypothetical protein